MKVGLVRSIHSGGGNMRTEFPEAIKARTPASGGGEPIASEWYETPAGVVQVWGPICPEKLRTLRMDPTLSHFRPAQRQHQALINIALRAGSRIYIVQHQDVIVGYMTFHVPEPIEGWDTQAAPSLLELGGIEVAPAWRGFGLGHALHRVAFGNDWIEDYIIFSTEYYWSWDLKGSGLSVWDYRHIMKKVMDRVGLVQYPTNDPDICSHPANMLTARIGSRVPLEEVEAFHYMRQHRYHLKTN